MYKYRKALQRMLANLSFRQSEKLTTCAICKRDSSDTVCAVCLSCDKDIQARRKSKRAYHRQEKRHGAFSGYATGRIA